MRYPQDTALLRRLRVQQQVEVCRECSVSKEGLDCGGQGRVRGEWTQEIKAGMKPSGSLRAEKLFSVVLSRLCFLPLGPFCTRGPLSLEPVRAESRCSPASVPTASLAGGSPFAGPPASLRFPCVEWYLTSKDKCSPAGFAPEPKSWDHPVACWDLLCTHHCTNKIIFVFIVIFSCLEPR